MNAQAVTVMSILHSGLPWDHLIGFAEYVRVQCAYNLAMLDIIAKVIQHWIRVS